MQDLEKLAKRAAETKSESRQIEFKREFDVDSNEAWCELIKDIVAMANSGGGIIVFGIANDGQASREDVAAVLEYDPANIVNKIFRYTSVQFADFQIVKVLRNGNEFPALVISGSDVPIIFTKPGTHEIGGGKQKTSFSQGTIYFRHGSKSEPGNRDDLVKWRDECLKSARKNLLSGIKKVVEAPRGHVVNVVALVSRSPLPAAIARLSNDPNAAKIVPLNAEELWPYRQKDFQKYVNSKLPKGVRINGHDVYCINRIYEPLRKYQEFAYKPHRMASPQYSGAFGDWIVQQYQKDLNFFAATREETRKLNAKKTK